jgi:hypothetical protein
MIVVAFLLGVICGIGVTYGLMMVAVPKGRT